MMLERLHALQSENLEDRGHQSGNCRPFAHLGNSEEESLKRGKGK